MFPRAQRLRTTKDILYVLRRGNRRSTGVVACSFVAKPGNLSRVTVIVDSKVSKSAVVRNLCKRRVRAILGALPLPGGDLIVRLYSGAQNLGYAELKSKVEECLNKAVR